MLCSRITIGFVLSVLSMGAIAGGELYQLEKEPLTVEELGDARAFGFTIGMTDPLALAQEKGYPIVSEEVNGVADGKTVCVGYTASAIPMLERICLDIHETDVLVGLVGFFRDDWDDTAFHWMDDFLSKRMVEERRIVPFVGNKEVIFRDDETLFILEDRHLGMDATLNVTSPWLKRQFARTAVWIEEMEQALAERDF